MYFLVYSLSNSCSVVEVYLCIFLDLDLEIFFLLSFHHHHLLLIYLCRFGFVYLLSLFSLSSLFQLQTGCSCSNSQRGPFQFLVRTTHGRSRSLMFHSLVRISHGKALFNVLRFSLSPQRYTTLPKRRP